MVSTHKHYSETHYKGNKCFFLLLLLLLLLFFDHKVSMGIWVNGVQNVSSQTVNLFYTSPRPSDGWSGAMLPGTSRNINRVTGDKSEAYGISLNIDGKRTYFYIWDEAWRLYVEVDGIPASKSLNITRNYGEYKIIIDDWGITIQDISQGAWALSLGAVSRPYYNFIPSDGVLNVEARWERE